MPVRPGRIAASLVAFMLVAGCSPAPTPSPAQSPAVVAQATPTPEPAAPPVLTSEELIAAALSAGSITYEQSILYRALALYDSPGLPTGFRSTVPDMHAAGELLREIDAKEATLSPGILKQLAPYRVRPADPTSIFNSPPARTDVGAVMVADVIPTWKSVPAAGGKARVWVKDSGDTAAALAKHADDVAKVWATFPGIFRYPLPDQPNDPYVQVNPDNAIDFYFVDGTTLDPRQLACLNDPTLSFCLFGWENNGYSREALPDKGDTSSAYLVIDSSIGGDQAVETIAHELAHAGQYAYDKNESTWLMESTATWVAYRVMKKLDLVPSYQYSYLKQFFEGLDQPLTRETDKNQYASWLYFLFASMQKGDGVVTDIWKVAAAEGEQGEKAVDKVFPFDTNFPLFSVRDWNRDPVDPRYATADPTFPKNYQPATRNKVKTLAGGKEDSLDVSLPPLASAYYDYVFTDTALDVTFQNALNGVPNAHVWAIKNVHDNWLAPEDWTQSAKKLFCRDIPAQDLTQIIIVVSNASMTKPLKITDPPKLVAGTKGCSGWDGTMTGTYDWHLGTNHGTGTASFSGLWVAVPDSQPIVPCQDGLPDSCIVYLPEGSIHWTWDAHQSPPGPACSETRAGDFPAGTINDPRYNASGAVPLSTQSLVLQPDSAGHFGYSGIASWPTPKLKCSNGDATTAPPSYFDLSADASGSGAADGTGNTCDHTTWQIDAKATTITGSCYSWNNAGSSMMYEWNLKRVGPAPGS